MRCAFHGLSSADAASFFASLFSVLRVPPFFEYGAGKQGYAAFGSKLTNVENVRVSPLALSPKLG